MDTGLKCYQNIHITIIAFFFCLIVYDYDTDIMCYCYYNAIVVTPQINRHYETHMSLSSDLYRTRRHCPRCFEKGTILSWEFLS